MLAIRQEAVSISPTSAPEVLSDERSKARADRGANESGRDDRPIAGGWCRLASPATSNSNTQRRLTPCVSPSSPGRPSWRPSRLRESHALTPTSSRSRGDWSTSNSTVIKTADGVHFGTYADGGAIGGSLNYKGANGLKLSDVNDYSFTFNYKQAGNLYGRDSLLPASSSTPTDGDRRRLDADVILDPSLGGPRACPLQGADIRPSVPPTTRFATATTPASGSAVSGPRSSLTTATDVSRTCSSRRATRWARTCRPW